MLNLQMNLRQIIGFAGTGLVLIAYIPQVRHLIEEKCSAGISRKAFVIWLVSSAALLVTAILDLNYVFICLQSVNLTATAVILYCAQKYKDSVCEYHQKKNKLSSSQIS